jgi:SAM-dependent methyltransferase
MPIRDATQRFSSRVKDYARYRPGYPPEGIELLQADCGLTAQSVVADIACGTGIFTRMLLETGARVFGVEPNAEMRRAGQEFLTGYSRFTSVNGTAEVTTLPDQSVDLITAAQAAHWFDPGKARGEFVRILKPSGWLVLLWNDRRTNASQFSREYENLLLTYGTDYHEVRRLGADLTAKAFFGSSEFRTCTFANRQAFDYAGLEGRLLSSSYTPQNGSPEYEPMLQELRRIFAANQVNGRVMFDYDAQVYYGRISMARASADCGGVCGK